MWELTNKKRIGIVKMKETLCVDIREYYEDKGEMKPGKRGIMLSKADFEILTKLIDEIKKNL